MAASGKRRTTTSSDRRAGRASSRTDRGTVGDDTGSYSHSEREGQPPGDASGEENNALGAFIRAQRQRANLSLRQLSGMTAISNAYLSQVERGLHEPSIRVVKSVAEALGLSPEALLAKAGLISDQVDAGPVERQPTDATEQAIMDDDLLEPAEKQALITVYRSYVAGRY